MTTGCRAPGTRRRGRRVGALTLEGPPRQQKLMNVSDNFHISGEAPRARLTMGALAHGITVCGGRVTAD
jgi:hypothetical protein